MCEKDRDRERRERETQAEIDIMAGKCLGCMLQESILDRSKNKDQGLN